MIVKYNCTKQSSKVIYFWLAYFQVEIHHARSVIEVFDAVSYEKGSTVIRMLQDYLGDGIFQVTKLLLIPELLKWSYVFFLCWILLRIWAPHIIKPAIVY